jgi:hypothetical protein
MSYRVSASVQTQGHLNVYGRPLWLFFWLLIYVNRKTGAIILNFPTLSRELGMSEELTRTAIRALVAWGYISIQTIGPYIWIKIIRWGQPDIDSVVNQAIPLMQRDGIERSDEFFIGTIYRDIFTALSSILRQLPSYFQSVISSSWSVIGAAMQ